jgi:hypothetical protein
MSPVLAQVALWANSEDQSTQAGHSVNKLFRLLSSQMDPLWNPPKTQVIWGSHDGETEWVQIKFCFLFSRKNFSLHLKTIFELGMVAHACNLFYFYFFFKLFIRTYNAWVISPPRPPPPPKKPPTPPLPPTPPPLSPPYALDTQQKLKLSLITILIYTNKFCLGLLF